MIFKLMKPDEFEGCRAEEGERLYDKIGDKAEGKVVLVTERGVLCRVCKKSPAKQSGQAAD